MEIIAQVHDRATFFTSLLFLRIDIASTMEYSKCRARPIFCIENDKIASLCHRAVSRLRQRTWIGGQAILTFLHSLSDVPFRLWTCIVGSFLSRTRIQPPIDGCKRSSQKGKCLSATQMSLKNNTSVPFMIRGIRFSVAFREGFG